MNNLRTKMATFAGHSTSRKITTMFGATSIAVASLAASSLQGAIVSGFGSTDVRPLGSVVSASNDLWTLTNGGCCNQNNGMVGLNAPSTLHMGYGGYDTGTAFITSAQDISRGFTASFTITSSGNGNGGVSFIVQNDPRGVGAVGHNNGGMGYTNQGDGSGGVTKIVNSFAAGLYTGSGATLGGNSVFNNVVFSTNGDNFTSGQASGVTYQSAPVDTVITYDSSLHNLSVKFTQGATINTIVLATGFDPTTLLGGNTGFIGFGTGSSGSGNPGVITNFSLDIPPVPEPETYASILAILTLGISVLYRRRSR